MLKVVRGVGKARDGFHHHRLMGMGECPGLGDGDRGEVLLEARNNRVVKLRPIFHIDQEAFQTDNVIRF